MIQHEDNEREARDASRELGIAMAIMVGLVAMVCAIGYLITAV